MSAKAKLRLRHIEDADQSKTTNSSPLVATASAVSSEDVALKTKIVLPGDSPLNINSESESAVGELLRRNRVESDLSLEDVAQQLRIQRSYLEALEQGEFDNLPGLTYAIGYVRSYAKLLDLDPDTLIADFKSEAKKLQEPTQLSFPSPAPEGKVPGGALVFVGIFLAALSYGGWYYLSTSESTVSDLTPEIPDRLAFLLEEPAINTPAMAGSVPSASESTTADAATPAPISNESSPPLIQTPSETKAVSSDIPKEPLVASLAPLPAVVPAPPETAQQSNVPASTEPTAEVATSVEIPAAPQSSEAVSPVEQVTELPAPVDSAGSDNTSLPAPSPAVQQIASVPETAPTPAAPDIPNVPEVPRQETAATGRSGAEAEAAAIDSRPKPVPVGSQTGPLIVISATDDSWVQVRGSDASPLLTRILRKGEHYEVPARVGLKLFTGNAGALKISVNGTEVPSLGPFGKIARNIPLDETLLTYTIPD